MKHLGSLAAMAEELMLRAPAIAVELHEGLALVAEKIEATARAEFGEYQQAAGPFQAWAELADATKDDRVHQGFPENEPLLRTGELRDSLSHQVEGLEAVIGSTDDKMVFHELGTVNMPPRPVLGPAAFHSKAAIEKLVGAAAVCGLVGRDQIHEALGYDFKTAD